MRTEKPSMPSTLVLFPIERLAVLERERCVPYLHGGKKRRAVRSRDERGGEMRQLKILFTVSRYAGVPVPRV